MSNIYTPSPEELGRRRFPDNKAFRKRLSIASIEILNQMQDFLASNYPKDLSTNLNLFNRVIAREIARVNISMQDINSDKDYTRTRAQYLNQILGDRLLLGPRIAPSNYNDESYRRYLIAIKDADLKGSKKEVIEALASEFTGQTVNIRELYLYARDPHSSLDVTSAHKMVVQVLIDNALQAGQNINVLKDNLDFFINLVRPAHVLYDTELIWTEQLNTNKIYDLLFGDTGGGCIPVYDFQPFDEPVILALQVFVLRDPVGATGIIDSIHHTDYIFYLNDSTKVITEPGINGTKIYDINGKQITINGLEIGQYVRINYQIIPGNFQFWWYPSEILTTSHSQFYRDIYRLPLFQETVKKVMDSKGRFPLQIKTTPTTLCDRWVQDALQPLYEDLRGNCGGEQAFSTSEVLSVRRGYPKLSWPYPSSEIHDSVLLGNDYVQFMEYYPLTDGSSGPATPSNISVKLNGTALTAAVASVDASNGQVYLKDSAAYWEANFGRYPVSGDEFTFSYKYLKDGTNYDATTQAVFGMSYWQLPKVPIVKGNGLGSLADKADIRVYVDGTAIQDAIIALDPLLGHVILSPYSNFWLNSPLGRLPIATTTIDGTVHSGDTFKFDYYYAIGFDYSLLFDDPGRMMDSKAGKGCPYGMLFDGYGEISAMEKDAPEQIGYRYRAYFLHHSSVLNSPNTLKLNNYQKPVKRASIINQEAVLNHFNKVFSPEFLYDTDPLPDSLGDSYLDNKLNPVLKLNAGTPVFQKTFSYHPRLIYQKKLQDIRENHKLLLYSDLLLKEFRSGNSEVNLSSICDLERVSFKVRITEELPAIAECSPWILFDTLQTELKTLSIPGDYKSVPNLRVADKLLRENFILRGVEPTGTALFSYILTQPGSTINPLSFTLPATYKMFLEDEWIDFPTLPIVDKDGNPATVADITCTIDGIPRKVMTLNPVTGQVTVEDYSTKVYGDIITLTEKDIKNRGITLSGIPDNMENISVSIIHGSSQFLYKDFRIIGNFLSWHFSELANYLEAGDQLQLIYCYFPVFTKIEFTYYIINSTIAEIIDRNRSRIMDDKYVFDGICYDQEAVKLNIQLNEYYGFMDDNSDGIKLSFFNKDTLKIEEHVFSGPVFEYYDVKEDEIGVPANFPNALVRISNPLSFDNPLNFSADYGFLNDRLVRFRKKVYKELLPDRTFRTLKLVEMLPI